MKQIVKKYDGLTLDEERALYGASAAEIKNCHFEGPADGESCLKETVDLIIDSCYFALRYPLWHNSDSELLNSEMTETCRAPLWYDSNLIIDNLVCKGVKAVRECDNVLIKNSDISSTEFCWMSRGINIENVKLTSEYPFFYVNNAEINALEMHGKYSLQYCENIVIKNSVLYTKDAFWHSKNVTVEDSVIIGEYLAWYSENLTLINCTIKGTQPLCYSKNLVMKNCRMEGCDLSFENSIVDCDIIGNIDSVKNPIGYITADSIGDIIIDEFTRGSCKIIQKSKN